MTKKADKLSLICITSTKKTRTASKLIQSSELGDRFSIIKGENMKDRQKALEAWKEDHFGSSEGFEDDWEAERKDDRLKVWEDRFFNDEADLY